MIELIKGILVLLAAIFVSIFLLPFELIYSFGYSFWLLLTFKKTKPFFVFWIRLVDGILSAIGYLLKSAAISLDYMWNVNGELIEDLVTNKESTLFSSKNITVSTSIGQLQNQHRLKKSGIKFSKILNVVFGQKNHAIDSYEYYLKKKELETNLFQ